MKSATALAKVRKLCLALPGAFEKIAWNAPTFRNKKGVFVMFLDNHHGDGRLAIWCNAPEGAQEALVAADPDRFFRPPYVGPGGWVGVCLDRGLEWSEVGAIIEQAYRTTAARGKKK
ncbi:MAG: MmcQ/YjbR family DNA-binding protein [Thermoanaerobaculia bacterium]